MSGRATAGEGDPSLGSPGAGSEDGGRVKVLLVSSHPVQYAVPLFRRYSSEPGLDVTVAYISLRGAEPTRDPHFGVTVAWDIPLLDGYDWVAVRDRAGPMTRRVVGSMAFGLWRLVRERRFDVVVCYGYRTASFWIAAAAARTIGARLVWSTDAIRLAPRGDDLGVSVRSKMKRLLLPLVFRTGDAVFGASTRSLAFLRSIGVRGPNVFLMPFVVDNKFFEVGAAQADPGSVRRAWGVPPDAFVVLFSGKLVPWKRPQDVLAAAATIPDAWAVFAGDGPLREDLVRRADALGMGDRVRFLGFVNQSSLPGTYRTADVLVLPSSFEPFGLVVNEAFASGIPAICTTDCGAAGDLIRDGETGFTYPSGDVDALSGLLRRVSVDPELRIRLTRGARARIGEWGIEENARSFIRAVRTIAEGRR